MRIGGAARYFAELHTQKDVENIVMFAEEKKLPLVMLGGGSNTIFADGVIEAVVARVVADGVVLRDSPVALRDDPSLRSGSLSVTRRIVSKDDTIITVKSGTILASLLNELAEQNLDLSPLTGIPGTVGGAIFGNAGQGFGGTWIGSSVQSVTFYHEGQWKTFSQEECHFSYRESWFKYAACDAQGIPIIWSVALLVPSRPKEEVRAEIERLLLRRIETQPHLKTAGSCFKSLPDGTPAWKIIDGAGLRGFRVGDIQVAEKHANFLLNVGKASFADATALVERIRSDVGPLDVEMRFFGQKGSVVF